MSKTSTADPLAGHRAIRLGQCHDCEGPLVDATGTFSERMVSVGPSSAYAAAVCNDCKRKHQEVNRPRKLK